MSLLSCRSSPVCQTKREPASPQRGRPYSQSPLSRAPAALPTSRQNDAHTKSERRGNQEHDGGGGGGAGMGAAAIGGRRRAEGPPELISLDESPEASKGEKSEVKGQRRMSFAGKSNRGIGVKSSSSSSSKAESKLTLDGGTTTTTTSILRHQIKVSVDGRYQGAAKTRKFDKNQ